jgi:hypothetical protein
MAAVIAAACRLSSVASRIAAVVAAWRRLATGEVAASRTIGSTMKASSRPPSVHITAPNQPPGQRRTGAPAGFMCPLRRPAAVVPVPYLAAPGRACRSACQPPEAGHGVGESSQRGRDVGLAAGQRG